MRRGDAAMTFSWAISVGNRMEEVEVSCFAVLDREGEIAPCCEGVFDLFCEVGEAEEGSGESDCWPALRLLTATTFIVFSKTFHNFTVLSVVDVNHKKFYLAI